MEYLPIYYLVLTGAAGSANKNIMSLMYPEDYLIMTLWTQGSMSRLEDNTFVCTL